MSDTHDNDGRPVTPLYDQTAGSAVPDADTAYAPPVVEPFDPASPVDDERGDLHRCPLRPAEGGEGQPLDGVLRPGRGAVEADRSHQGAPEPGGEADVVHAADDGVAT